jgi:transcriptional antiterminator NusG
MASFYNGYPNPTNITHNTLSLFMKTDEDVDIYYVGWVNEGANLSKKQPLPTAPQVKKGQDAQGNSVTLAGKCPVVAHKEAEIQIANLMPLATYNIFVVAENKQGDVTTVAKTEVKTTAPWYVVHTYSNYENAVKLSLEERIKHSDLQDKFGRILVPIEEVVEMKDGVKRKSERKLYPGYVLVEMIMNDETWHIVKNVPKVMGFIGGQADRKGKNDKFIPPTPLSKKEANTILQQVQERHEKPLPKILFEVGEMVRVSEGPFTDFSGVVEEVNYEKNRLRVAVLIFGRSTPVELEFGQVEKE